MNTNYRPGVFCDYLITTSQKNSQGKPIGIIANSSITANNNKIKKFTNINQALIDYADENGVLDFLRTITQNCNSEIFIVSVDNTSQNKTKLYKDAFDLLFNNNDIYCVVSDFVNQEMLTHIKTKFAENRAISKIFACNFSDINNDIQVVKSLNCERICIAAPAFFRPLCSTNVACAALIAILARTTLPISNCVGESVIGEHVCSVNLSETQKQLFIESGISSFEEIGGKYELIRGVTSRAQNENGDFSSTYRNIGVVTGLDFVLSQLKIVISKCLKNGGSSLNTLSSIIICELLKLRSKQIITDYSKPIITQSKTDLSSCQAEIFIQLQQNINRVELKLNFNI